MSVHNAYLTFMMSGFYFGGYIFTWLLLVSPFFLFFISIFCSTFLHSFFVLFFTSISLHSSFFSLHSSSFSFHSSCLFSPFYFPFLFLIQNIVLYALCSVCIILNWFWAKKSIEKDATGSIELHIQRPCHDQRA